MGNCIYGQSFLAIQPNTRALEQGTDDDLLPLCS